jgi:hypothetical protein
MKKLLIILLVTSIIIACGSNKTEESTTKELSADSIKSSSDTSMRSGPAHGMNPMDTAGRRPRDKNDDNQ